MGMILIMFQKKVLFGVNGSFWAQKWCILITLGLLYKFFEVLDNKKGQ